MAASTDLRESAGSTRHLASGDIQRAECGPPVAAAWAMLEKSADIIALVDDQACLVYANPAAEHILGWGAAAKLGDSLLDLVHPDDLARVMDAMAVALGMPGPQDEVIYRMATSDGSWVTMASTSTNLLDDPAVRGIVVNARDVSERVDALNSLVATLVRASEVRDPYTAGHQRSVAELSGRICVALGLPYQEVDRIRLGAELHDIGKIAIPAEILTKPGKLSPAQWELVKEHPTTGFEILSSAKMAEPIADIVLHHHERLDGSGYPHGLSGESVNVGARVVAVADTIDAICSHRPYRAAPGLEIALDVIGNGRGTLFDPDVVDAAVAVATKDLEAPWSNRARRE